ncbi:Hypothetical protein FKW44_009355 [Caligus rogercresseyi]|uniref:Uncharacterized protein n=1 Tax=Caligus rogercresseyi TaxID=217165 RepID=A0A7T8HF69_CALRO|nr:Hypothetical protein FKW44_009355 [Caligus rogercresseyi]
MAPQIPPNTIRVFWGYKPTANGPSGSAEHTRGVLGLQTHRQWPSGSAEHTQGVLGLQIPCQWDLGFRQT